MREAEAPTFPRQSVVRLSSLCAAALYPQEDYFYLFLLEPTKKKIGLSGSKFNKRTVT
jgi:hypothetical protein